MPAASVTRLLRRTCLAIVLVLIAMVFAACGADTTSTNSTSTTATAGGGGGDEPRQHPGSDDDSGAGAPPGSGSGGPGAAPPVPDHTPLDARLTIVIDDGEGSRRTERVHCENATIVMSTTCGYLAAVRHQFAPLPRDRACTEIYGGPQTAHAVGTIDGRAVDIVFRRTNGCEIAQWDAVSPVWGDASQGDRSK